jgi:hypothetical protein
MALTSLLLGWLQSVRPTRLYWQSQISVDEIVTGVGAKKLVLLAAGLRTDFFTFFTFGAALAFITLATRFFFCCGLFRGSFFRHGLFYGRLLCFGGLLCGFFGRFFRSHKASSQNGQYINGNLL